MQRTGNTAGWKERRTVDGGEYYHNVETDEVSWDTPLAPAREALPRSRGLRELVLVVREAEVEAAAVDVEGAAEVALAHRRALDVPAGATGAPRRAP